MASPYQSLAPVVSGEGGGGGGVDAEARAQITLLQEDLAEVTSDVTAMQADVNAAESSLIALDSRLDVLEAGSGGGGLPSWEDYLTAPQVFSDVLEAYLLSFSSSYMTLAGAHADFPGSHGIIYNTTPNASNAEGSVAVAFRTLAGTVISGDFEWIGQFAISALITGTAGYTFRLGMSNKALYNNILSYFIGFEIGGVSAANSGIRPWALMSGVEHLGASWIPLTAKTRITVKIKYIAETKTYYFYVNDMNTHIATHTFAAGVAIYQGTINGYFSKQPTRMTGEANCYFYIDNMYFKQTIGARI